MRRVEQQVSFGRLDIRRHPQAQAGLAVQPLHAHRLGQPLVLPPVGGQRLACPLLNVRQSGGSRNFQPHQGHVFGHRSVAVDTLFKLAQRPACAAIDQLTRPRASGVPAAIAQCRAETQIGQPQRTRKGDAPDRDNAQTTPPY